MDTLQAMLSAHLDNSLDAEAFSNQFIDYWNVIRAEQNKAIDEAGIRDTLNNLWKQYKAGDMDEVAYGMEWTTTLTKLPPTIRILPQSILYAIGNELYTILIMLQEEEHLETQDVPSLDSVREYCQILIDTIEN